MDEWIEVVCAACGKTFEAQIYTVLCQKIVDCAYCSKPVMVTEGMRVAARAKLPNPNAKNIDGWEGGRPLFDEEKDGMGIEEER